jgi:hypothetical protein
MSTVDPDARYVAELKGTGLAIVATSLVCVVISTIIVGLRSYLRTYERVFGWDDGLMIGGLVSLPR